MPRGFTLVEMVVVVAIMAILGLAVALAYPHARAEQKLTLAEQTLQAALRGAQQSAINEERDPDCLAALPSGMPPERCSDTGIVLCPGDPTMIIFADIVDPDDNNFDCRARNDFIVAEIPFPDGVLVEPSNPPTILLFQGTPPTIHLFSNVGEITNFEPVTLRIGNITRELNVGSYGQVERR